MYLVQLLCLDLGWLYRLKMGDNRPEVACIGWPGLSWMGRVDQHVHEEIAPCRR